MLENARKTETPSDESPFEAALKALLTPCEIASQINREDKALILGLIARLRPELQSPYLARLNALKLAPVNIGGDAYQKVIHLIDHHRQSEWKNAEIQKRLEEAG